MAMPSEVWLPSPNYTGDGITPNKFVFHTTEGAMTIRDLGAWFAQPVAQCSSHWGVDNFEPGVVGAYVYESNRAWTQANANPYCLSVEMCGYASWSRDTWLNGKGVLLRTVADLCGAVCRKYAIPIRALSATEAQAPGVKGCCQHRDFGAWGGGHSDCGDGFPMDTVLQWAAQGAPVTKPPASKRGSEDMPAITVGPEVGISFNGDEYSSVGFSADVRGGKIKLRVAVRRVTGAYAVSNVELRPGQTKAVVAIPADFPSDGCSITRTDESVDPPGIVLYPNFAPR